MNHNISRAILLASSGTASLDVFNKTINPIEDKIKNMYPEYKILKAFTSDRIIEIIDSQYSVKMHSLETALLSLYKEGYKEIYIQSLHLVPGSEFEKIEGIVKRFSYINYFDKLLLGKPILYEYNDEAEDDYDRLIEVLSKHFLKIKNDESIIFLGHGGLNFYNVFYENFQSKLKKNGFNNAYVFTTKNYLELANINANFIVKNINKVYLVPFMIFAGGHVKKYMVGESSNSLKNILINNKIKVDTYLQGLGEDEDVRNIFLERLEEICPIDK